MRKIYCMLLVLALPYLSGAQIANAGFESWYVSYAGDSAPVPIEVASSWYGSDSLIIALGQTIGAIALNSQDSDWRRQIFQVSAPEPVHSGSHSAKIMTVLEDSFFVPGVLSNAIPNFALSYPPPGITAIQFSGGSPVSFRPTSVSAWVQYFPGLEGTAIGIDSGSLTVYAISNVGGKDSVVGMGVLVIAPTGNQWAHINDSIIYTDTLHPVDTIQVSFSSGRGTTGLQNSTLYVDDVTMGGVTNPIDRTGVSNVAINDGPVKVYPNPSAGILYIDGPQNEELTCRLFSMNGQAVNVKTLAGRGALDVSALPDGLYFYTIQDTNGDIVQRGKVAVSR